MMMPGTDVPASVVASQSVPVRNLLDASSSGWARLCASMTLRDVSAHIRSAHRRRDRNGNRHDYPHIL